MIQSTSPSALAYIYFGCLTFITAGLLGWGLSRRERIYQYPFIAGSVFASFIIPQSIALLNRPNVATQHSLERVFLMSCLCAAMCWFGYQMPADRSWLKRLNISVNPTKLLQGGLFLVGLSLMFSFLIGSSRGQLTGSITIFKFFRSLAFPGLAICLLSALEKSSFIRNIFVLIASIVPIQIMILDGKREATAIFFLTIGLCLYYCYKKLPSRWIVICLIFVSLLVIPLIGEYRTLVRNDNWNQISELRPVENFRDYVDKGETLELRNAAMIIDATIRTSRYGYGRGYWDEFVFRSIPGQVIGKKLKRSLMINKRVNNAYLSYLYNYRMSTGTTWTGMGDAFAEFDYFGCLVFFLIAYFFKILWTSAIFSNSLFSQIMYVELITSGMTAITHGTVRFTGDLLLASIFIGVVFLYARRKEQKYVNLRQLVTTQKHK